MKTMNWSIAVCGLLIGALSVPFAAARFTDRAPTVRPPEEATEAAEVEEEVIVAEEREPETVEERLEDIEYAIERLFRIVDPHNRRDDSLLERRLRDLERSIEDLERQIRRLEAEIRR